MHTPGPWIKDTEGAWQEYDADSAMIMIFGPEGEGFGRIAHVYAECGGEVEANAEFIVRACNSHADLLKALEKLVSVCKSDDIFPHVKGHIELAEKAITKAKGE